MNLSGTLLITMLLLGTASPLVALYAASLAKKKNYRSHKRTHKTLFAAMAFLVIIFEMNMIFSKSGGFLPDNNPLIETPFFSALLSAHVIGAVITFVIWGSILFISLRKFKNGLPGKFSRVHKTFGYITILGLFYIAVTALLITTIAYIF